MKKAEKVFLRLFRKNDMELPKRKHSRLKNFDYSTPARYFVTLCVKDRSEILSDVGPHDPMRPNKKEFEDDVQIINTEIGEIVEKHILEFKKAYKNVYAEKYVIMPNHVHMIIKIDGDINNESDNPSLPLIVRAFKRSITTELGFSIFQRSFYEHIIRNDAEFYKICKYIDDNSQKHYLSETQDF